jgi:hypothetical protein
VVACAAQTAIVVGQTAAPPDFSSNETAWVSTLGDFLPPRSGPGPVGSDPAHPRSIGEQQYFRIADLTNPILRPWAVEQMRKSNEDVLGGKIAYTAHSSCMPAGVPGFLLFPFAPVHFIQSPKQVLIVWSGDQQVRRIHLDVPHSQVTKPSWYGESIGHYEGDTLVVDTIGQNATTFIDSYRTPHSEKLHVIERYRLMDGGRTLQVDIRVEDDDAFTMAWTAIQRYRRVEEPMLERVCAENAGLIYDYNIPQSDKPDF